MWRWSSLRRKGDNMDKQQALKIEKIQDKEKLEAVCQYSGDNCSTMQAPNAHIDPCYDDCKQISGHDSYWKSQYW